MTPADMSCTGHKACVLPVCAYTCVTWIRSECKKALAHPRAVVSLETDSPFNSANALAHPWAVASLEIDSPLTLPMHWPTHGQWWSKRSTQLLQMLQ